MNIQTSKIELVKLILETNDPTLIEKVYGLFKGRQNPSHEFTEEQLREIELGLDQLEKGERISFKDYLKKVS